MTTPRWSLTRWSGRSRMLLILAVAVPLAASPLVTTGDARTVTPAHRGTGVVPDASSATEADRARPAERIDPSFTGAGVARAFLRNPRPGALPYGLYQILWRRSGYGAMVDQEAAAIGTPPRFVLFFRDLGSRYPVSTCAEVLARGALPVISIEVEHWRGPREGRLQAIARGEYDERMARYARDARESGQVCLYRFGFEMNGDWFSWGGEPELFATAWRRLHDIFTREGATNVLWVWAPNAVSGPDHPENGLEKYWPGDAYVDVIGLDGYNFGDGHSQWHDWESAEEVFADALTKIRSSGVPHPVLITEFGCTDEGEPRDRARWIREAHTTFAREPNVVGAIWFNYDKRREGEPNWRIDADDASLQAFREVFGGE